jgi:uncharacterized protein (DUF302 family)
MGKYVFVLVIGMLAGMGLLGVVAYNMAAGIMITQDVSSLGFDETVTAIQENAKTAGWKVPAVHPISESVAKVGFDVNRLTVVELCKAELAGRILKDSEDWSVTPMMPCRAAVYEKSNGEVVIARMNSGLMSRFFGSTVARVMGIAAAENEEMFREILVQ